MLLTISTRENIGNQFMVEVFFRYNKAQKEISEKNIVPIETIIEYVNEVLKTVGIAEVEKPIMNPSEVDYTSLKKRV